MRTSLADLRALLIDMDGVLWVGDTMLPGVGELFDFLRAHHIRFILVSNNATRRADYTVERLARHNIQVAPEDVLTSAEAAPRWIALQMPEIKQVYVVGEKALDEAIREAGLEIVERDADAVVVGLDRELTYATLERATLEIRRGARFIATNTDKTLPAEHGLTPGAGTIVAALIAATDVEPLVIGKPAQPMFELAMEMAGSAPAETAMLGDRLDTDIDGAAAAGLKTIMVLTGVSSRADAEKNGVYPDFIFDDLPALTRAWAESY